MPLTHIACRKSTIPIVSCCHAHQAQVLQVLEGPGLGPRACWLHVVDSENLRMLWCSGALLLSMRAEEAGPLHPVPGLPNGEPGVPRPSGFEFGSRARPHSRRNTAADRSPRRSADSDGDQSIRLAFKADHLCGVE